MPLEGNVEEFMCDGSSEDLQLSYDNVDYFNASVEQVNASVEQVNVSVEQVNAESDNESMDSIGSATSDTGPGPQCEFQWDSAKFLLNLREEAMLSQSALNKAVDGVDDLFSRFSNSIKDRILEGADANGSVSEDHVKNVFGEFSNGMFSGIDSKTSLEGFAKENLNVLEPEQIELYSTEEWKDGGLNSVKHYAYVSPFLPSFKRLITRPDTGSLLFVCGDSPAVNVLGGFKESVGLANKPCHKCEVDHEQMKLIFREDAFEKRTADKLEAQRADLQNSTTQKTRHEKSTLYGINGPPVISNMKGFCPVLSFCYDLMHILHEGVLEVAIRFLIKYAVDVKEVITIDEINTDIKLMAHQLYSKDKPAPILQGHQNTGLRQSAAQMLSLALCIPFVLMKKADDSDLQERLLNFTLLLQISMGLLAYELTTKDLAQLRKMIQTHHERFIEHYPDYDVPPKFHYLIHIPSQIENFGPARVTWTFRFEAMHSYFKNIIRTIKNFINPPLSCIKRYESLRASQMLVRPGHQPKDFLNKNDVYTKPLKVKVSDHPQKALLCGAVNSKDTIITCKKLKSKVSVFSINSIVLLDDEPTFGKVLDILIVNEIKILIVSIMKTVQYEPMCNAYYLEDDPHEVKMWLLENLQHPLPFISMSAHAAPKYLWNIPKYHKIGFNHP